MEAFASYVLPIGLGPRSSGSLLEHLHGITAFLEHSG